jgi:hypothetical protein
MTTREEAERKACELNEEAPRSMVAGGLFYSVDQSPETGAWRVLENRAHYCRKVVAS